MPLDRDRYDNQVSQGKTGFTSTKAGDTFYSVKNNAEFISRLPIGNPGQFYMVGVNKLPQWVTLAGILRSGLTSTSDVTEGSRLYFTSGRVIEVLDLQIAAGKLSAWRKITIPYTALAAASLSNDIELFELEQGELLETLKITEGTEFLGPSLTTLMTSIGIAGKPTKYSREFQIMSGDLKINRIENQESVATSIRLSVTADINLEDITNGSIHVWVRTSKELN